MERPRSDDTPDPAFGDAVAVRALDDPAAVDRWRSARRRRRVEPDPRANPWLVGLLVLAACEPANTPLRWLNDEPAARWWYLVPVWAGALAVGLADGRGLRGAVRAPARWLLAATVWMMLVSPFGLTPEVDLVTATGLAAFVLAGCAVVETGGWPMLRAALYPTSVILLVATALIEITELVGDRWVGVFRDANALAFGCVVAAVSGVDRWMRGSGSGGLLLAWASVPVLVLSDGRMAMVALVIAVVVIVRPALPRWLLPTALVLLVIVGSWLLADSGRRDDIGRAISRSGDSQEITTFTGRDRIWDIALEQIRDRPLVGVGAGSTPELFVQERLDGRIDYFDIVHAHDLWLQLGLSGGLPAIVFVAIGAVGFTLRALRRPVRDRDALLIAVLVHGITEDVIAEPRYTLVIVAAAFASVSRRERRRPQHDDQEPTSVHAVLHPAPLP